jgi:hypothetical protein
MLVVMVAMGQLEAWLLPQTAAQPDYPGPAPAHAGDLSAGAGNGARTGVAAAGAGAAVGASGAAPLADTPVADTPVADTPVALDSLHSLDSRNLLADADAPTYQRWEIPAAVIGGKFAAEPEEAPA